MIDEWGGIQWPLMKGKNEEFRMKTDSSFTERRLFCGWKIFHAGRPGDIPVRPAASGRRANGRGLSASAAPRTRDFCAVAHRFAH